MKYPVIVLTVGHTGSSTVTEYLQDDLGYYVGDKKMFAPHRGRFGARFTYEDPEFSHIIHFGLVLRKIQEITLRDFRERYIDLIEQRNEMGKPWGFKTAFCPQGVRELLMPFKRGEAFVIHSCREEYAMQDSDTAKIDALIDKSELDCLRVDFKTVVDDSFKDAVRAFLT